jgi:hypothetical protein
MKSSRRIFFLSFLSLLLFSLFPRKEYFATGKATVTVDAQSSEEAIGAVQPVLYAIEHLLTFAHGHHVFFTTLSCYGNEDLAAELESH